VNSTVVLHFSATETYSRNTNSKNHIQSQDKPLETELVTALSLMSSLRPFVDFCPRNGMLSHAEELWTLHSPVLYCLASRPLLTGKATSLVLA